MSKIPAAELEAPGVLCRTQRRGDYQITYNPGKSKFTLWKCGADGAEKVATGADIDKLYSQIPWTT